MRRKNTCQDPLTSKSARTLLSHCGDGVAVGSFRPHPQLAKRPMRSWVSTPLPNGDPWFLRKHDSKIAPFGIEVTLVDGHVAHPISPRGARMRDNRRLSPHDDGS